MHVFEKLGLKRLSLEEFKKEFRAPYMAFYRKFTNEPKEKIDALYLQGISSLKRPKLFPVKKTLEFLNRKRKKLAILSSYPQRKLEEEIKYHRLRKLFIDVTSGVHNKAEAIIVLMERNGFLTRETGYVGDMDYDVEVGKKAKVITIAVLWGWQTKERLVSAKPDFLIDRLSVREMKKIISQATQKVAFLFKTSPIFFEVFF